MNIDSVIKKLKKEGIRESICYYLSRFLSKMELQIIGKWTARHGKLQKNCIVFKNRTMQDMTDNLRAFFEYLIKNGFNRKYKIIWMVSDKRKLRDCSYENVKFVTAENRYGWTSPLAYYYGAAAGFFFYTNNTAYLNLYHCEGQMTVNMWHGCGYKDAPQEEKKTPAKSMMDFDYAMVPGAVFAETKARYWKCDKKKILPVGYPRYDWMLHPSVNREKALKKLFQMEDQRTVIWMPTFRKSDILIGKENQIELPYQLPALKSEEELQRLDRALERIHVLLIIKKHPLQSGWSMNTENYTNIRYVTEEMLEECNIQLYELVGNCDALISDYSSIAVDFMLLDRPIGYVLSDMDSYQETRGFVFEHPLDYMPGEKIYDYDGLEGFMIHAAGGEDLFRDQRRQLLPKMHNMPVKDSYCRELVEFLQL